MRRVLRVLTEWGIGVLLMESYTVEGGSDDVGQRAPTLVGKGLDLAQCGV